MIYVLRKFWLLSGIKLGPERLGFLKEEEGRPQTITIAYMGAQYGKGLVGGYDFSLWVSVFLMFPHKVRMYMAMVIFVFKVFDLMVSEFKNSIRGVF